MDATTNPAASDLPRPCGRWAEALVAAPPQNIAAARGIALAYWHPVYTFLRASGLEPEDAAVRTESALASLLSQLPTPLEAPLFREWMLRLSREALSGVGPHDDALVIDRAWAESRFTSHSSKTPDERFLHRWALTVVEFTLAAIEAEYCARGDEAQYLALQPFLGYSGGGDEAYGQLARKLGVSESAARVAVFELRKRFRAELKSQIAQTVARAGDIESELTALLCTL